MDTSFIPAESASEQRGIRDRLPCPYRPVPPGGGGGHGAAEERRRPAPSGAREPGGSVATAMPRPFAPPGWLDRQYGQAPPLKYFSKFAQVTLVLPAPLFSSTVSPNTRPKVTADIGRSRRGVSRSSPPFQIMCCKGEKGEKSTKSSHLHTALQKDLRSYLYG